MTVAQRRHRRILAAAFAGALVPAAAAGGAAAQTPDTEIQTLIDQKVAPELIEEIDDKGDAELWLLFAGSPDYSAALDADTKEAKGAAAVEAAQEYAETSQDDVTAALDEAGVDYESYWGASTVKVQGDDELLAELVAFDEVEAVVAAPDYGMIEPIAPDGKAENDFQTWDAVRQAAVEWGVEDIGAPDVWEQGFTGEGIVVASIDTGVQYDHPALVEQYRGDNGDGTFTHDYNFYDIQDVCPGDAPCDEDGHGTHTTGTMVGSEGIGVAPGAEWIAVNACCPDIETLILAGQWIAAPTDSEGRNPDPIKAPHVVNNSWGTTIPGYDPIYAEVIDLWHASGIVPVFAAGNNGPACLTMSSPGVYENVIAVGAYDEAHAIAEFSSRGHGLNGTLKPDLSAPGVDVRSALPGDDYGLGDGTSMAAPHVVGAIALLMSASPALEGDYEAVYETLTGTAVDTADDQCTGDKEANNVYGHGRVDVEDAVDEAPDGKFGSLSGEVTDQDGEPVAGARLVFEGAVVREATTGADGTYDFTRIPAGRYHVTVSKFLYDTVTGSVRVKRDGEAVFDAALTKQETQVVEGVVLDGGGHGWPLEATVSTAGGEAAGATDPFTGEFSLEIPADGDWPLTVEVAYPGYETIEVDPADAALIEVPLSPGCLALGYGSDVLDERFESLTLPEGWEVVDRGETTGWVFDDPFGYGNMTPGSGGFAEANSDSADPELHVDTDLISPVFDLSASEDPTLSFASFFVDGGIGAEAEVLVSADGGATWDQVWHTDADLEATVETVDLSAWAAETDLQVKFHFDDHDTWAYWWMVDNVRIGCGEIEGGLVRGTVTDAATGDPIEGAVVTDPATGEAATTDADGGYVLFTDAGAATLEASSDGRGTDTADVEVEADAVVGADFALEAA
ncbi:S8 family serine peptidase [Glycomyces sp. TRM65418]|uniref:S8 family serine peptidase n=1 Tax=Glycomyces sp. TRM65418 TaxID=2867006 RepID=UPI001CE6DF2A|nr:S8 family serine peptidase [Glycomyces sp. TRM65418]MCC3762956.1 S8 family serine peptidase [Glycomyces sp. TRM65418]QZD56977.1 S8 family serine peptidase [Glycomyces sp. TRM65418]